MIAWFSLRLLCGMSLMWCCMPRREVTSGFFRIQMLVVLGLSVLTALSLEPVKSGSDVGLVTPSTASLVCYLLAACAFVGSVVWTLERRAAGGDFVFLIAAIGYGLLLATSIDAQSIQTSVGLLEMASAFATSAILGASVTGMLLGHWYLTAPTMSIAPLGRLNLFLGAATVFRLIVSAIGLWLAWSQLSGSTHILWVTLRWTAGIAGPLAVCLMVWRILKYQNTQAATGVLFVGVILTFIGEMTGALLAAELLLPF
jgi:hypothetical protein